MKNTQKAKKPWVLDLARRCLLWLAPHYPVLYDVLALDRGSRSMIYCEDLVLLFEKIKETKDNGGSVVEVGVYGGGTSRLLMKYMDELNDARPYVCIDTFSGFSKEDIQHEVEHRGKKAYEQSYKDSFYTAGGSICLSGRCKGRVMRLKCIRRMLLSLIFQK